MRLRIAVLLLAAIGPILVAQKRPTPPSETHYRVIMVDSVIVDSVKHTRMPAHAAGKLGFVAIYSKDGLHCLVEYVSASYEDFNDVRSQVAAANDPAIKLWEKAQMKHEDLQAAAKVAGYDVDFKKFYVRVP